MSTVEAQLAEGKDAFDVLIATFPAGTLTGAPKVRAMELIEELEPVRRGVYGGAVGYLDAAGDLDVAIAIRTAVMRDGKAYVQASAGIVADSVPGARGAGDPQQGARRAAGDRHRRDAAHDVDETRVRGVRARDRALRCSAAGVALLVSLRNWQTVTTPRPGRPPDVLGLSGRAVDSASTATRARRPGRRGGGAGDARA